MWHWMRVSVRASHRGWKMATRVVRLAIGVPDYEAFLLRTRIEPGTASDRQDANTPDAPPARVLVALHEDGRACADLRR